MISILLSSEFYQINQTDVNGQCPLVHAALHGQLDAASFLLQCEQTAIRDKRPTTNESLQQALTAAASAGHSAVSMHPVALTYLILPTLLSINLSNINFYLT